MPQWLHRQRVEPHEALPHDERETRHGLEATCRTCQEPLVEAKLRQDYAHHCICGARIVGWTVDQAAHDREFELWAANHRGPGHGPIPKHTARKARRPKGKP